MSATPSRDGTHKPAKAPPFRLVVPHRYFVLSGSMPKRQREIGCYDVSRHGQGEWKKRLRATQTCLKVSKLLL